MLWAQSVLPTGSRLTARTASACNCNREISILMLVCSDDGGPLHTLSLMCTGVTVQKVIMCMPVALSAGKDWLMLKQSISHDKC